MFLLRATNADAPDKCHLEMFCIYHSLLAAIKQQQGYP